MLRSILFLLCLIFSFACVALTKEAEIQVDLDVMRNFEDAQYGDGPRFGNDTFGDDLGADSPQDPLGGDREMDFGVDYYSADREHGANVDLSDIYDGKTPTQTGDLEKPSTGMRSTWDADRMRNARMVAEEKNRLFEGGPGPGHRVAPIDAPTTKKGSSNSTGKDLKVHSVIKETGGNVPLV